MRTGACSHSESLSQSRPETLARSTPRSGSTIRMNVRVLRMRAPGWSSGAVSGELLKKTGAGTHVEMVGAPVLNETKGRSRCKVCSGSSRSCCWRCLQ
jgi:hypothetical protein